MKKNLLVCSLFLLSPGLFAQWTEQASGFVSPSRGINQIVITDISTAWATAYDGAVTGGGILQEYTRTTDGGVTWIPGNVDAAPLTYNWSCFSAVDGNTAWALFYDADAGTTGGIFKTTDGGQLWTQQGAGIVFTDEAASFPDVIHFWDANQGVAAGDPVSGEFEIYTTADGGTTWTAVPAANIPDPLTGEWGYTRLVDAVDNIVWFGTNKGRIYKSTDYGITWSVVATGFSDLNSFHFKDENTGWAKNGNSFKRTVDGGTTWTTVTPSGHFFKNSFCYVPLTDNVLISTGANQTGGDWGSSYSLDGGDNWVTIDSAVQHLTVSFFNNYTGWTGGFNTDAETGGMFEYDGSFEPTGVSPVNSSYHFKLYPNPSNGLFYISFEAENNLPIDIQVSDGMGRIVLQKTYKNKNELWLRSLDLRNFSPGVYFLKVENNGTESMKKLVVQ